MGSLPHLLEDCHGILQVYSDGSIFRQHNINFNIPVHDDGSVVWTDRVFDKKHNLSLRLYKPTTTTTTTSVAITKLPILFYLHGGGFCVGSRTWPNCHNCCLRLAATLNAVVVSPDYRLAPEHKLPAAMDDSVAAMKWLRDVATCQYEDADTWMGDGVAFDRVFVLGDSSGGNVAHQMAVRFGPGSVELGPVRVRGYILMAPFFGGTERTKSEAEGEPEAYLNLDILDRFWRLSLPLGSTADHPYANPFGPDSPKLESIKLDPILVMAGGDELLKDRAEDYAMTLKGLGNKVDYVEFEGKQHGFFTNEPYSDVSDRVLQLITNFMHENSS